MVFVDTSVWVAAFRRPTGDTAARLRSLLDADEVGLALPVRVELLSGAAKKDRSRLRRALSGLPVAWPTEETWRDIERWVPTAADAGYTFGMPDLLIAALARERGALVWSNDSDFTAMEALGFVHQYE